MPVCNTATTLTAASPRLNKYLRTNTRKMIHDRFFHFVLIRMVKERGGELSVRRFRRGGSLEKTISLVRKEEFLVSESEADRQHTLRYHNTQAPPTHTHCSLSANYAACNEGVKWVVTQKHQEKQEGRRQLSQKVFMCRGDAVEAAGFSLRWPLSRHNFRLKDNYNIFIYSTRFIAPVPEFRSPDSAGGNACSRFISFFPSSQSVHQ